MWWLIATWDSGVALRLYNGVLEAQIAVHAFQYYPSKDIGDSVWSNAAKPVFQWYIYLRKAECQEFRSPVFWYNLAITDEWKRHLISNRKMNESMNQHVVSLGRFFSITWNRYKQVPIVTVIVKVFFKMLKQFWSVLEKPEISRCDNGLHAVIFIRRYYDINNFVTQLTISILWVII